jgi:hypothetical protein
VEFRKSIIITRKWRVICMNRFKESGPRCCYQTPHWLLLCALGLALFPFGRAFGQEEVETPDPVPQEGLESFQAGDSGINGITPIDDGGGQAAAMGAGEGGAGVAGAGATSGQQPISNPFNFQTDLITGRFTYTVPIAPAYRCQELRF